jgi:hypothetical protein
VGRPPTSTWPTTRPSRPWLKRPRLRGTARAPARRRAASASVGPALCWHAGRRWRMIGGRQMTCAQQKVGTRPRRAGAAEVNNTAAAHNSSSSTQQQQQQQQHEPQEQWRSSEDSSLGSGGTPFRRRCRWFFAVAATPFGVQRPGTPAGPLGAGAARIGATAAAQRMAANMRALVRTSRGCARSQGLGPRAPRPFSDTKVTCVCLCPIVGISSCVACTYPVRGDQCWRHGAEGARRPRRCRPGSIAVGVSRMFWGAWRLLPGGLSSGMFLLSRPRRHGMRP